MPVEDLPLYLHARGQPAAIHVGKHLKPCRFPSCAAELLYLLNRVAGGGAVLERHQALAQGVVRLCEERQALVLQCKVFGASGEAQGGASQ